MEGAAVMPITLSYAQRGVLATCLNYTDRGRWANLSGDWARVANELFQRGYLQRTGQKFQITDKGREALRGSGA